MSFDLAFGCKWTPEVRVKPGAITTFDRGAPFIIAA